MSASAEITGAHDRGGIVVAVEHNAKLGRKKLLLTMGLLAAATIATGLLAAGHWAEISGAVTQMPAKLLVAALALQAIASVCRLEAWRHCLRASGSDVSRKEIYAAGSVSFPLAVVNMQLASAARLAALKKIAPDHSPRLTALIAAELPVYATEILIGAVLLCIAAPALGIPFWAAPLLVAAAAAALALMRRGGRRETDGFLSGLAVLASTRSAGRLGALVGAMTAAQVTKVWVLLMAAGLLASPLDASAVVVGQGLLAQLPVGAAAASGASLLVFGSEGVGAATAAGLAVTATEVTAGIGFAVFVAPVLFLLARRAFRIAAHETGAAAGSPTTG